MTSRGTTVAQQKCGVDVTITHSCSEMANGDTFVSRYVSLSVLLRHFSTALDVRRSIEAIFRDSKGDVILISFLPTTIFFFFSLIIILHSKIYQRRRAVIH